MAQDFRFEGPRGERVPPSRRSHERMVARTERRRRSQRRLWTALAVAVPIAALLAGLVLWAVSPGDGTGDGSRDVVTGVPLRADATDGSSYSFAGVKAGVTADRRPYAEYVVTNTGTTEALFVMPVDLFVTDTLVPRGVPCRPTDGVPGACTVVNKPELVGPVADSGELRAEGADLYMKPGSSYLVRVTGQRPMTAGIKPEAVSLWLWQSLFYLDRHGRNVSFPK